MKRLLILLPVIICCVLAYSCNGRDNGEGIKFFKGTWAEAQAKAKAEHKPILLDIYASWCGPCKMLKKKTFTDKSVGDYFNANYICVSVDGEKGEGPGLAQQYHISGYPTLIVVNKDGGLVNLQVGFVPADELLEFGKKSYRN